MQSERYGSVVYIARVHFRRVVAVEGREQEGCGRKGMGEGCGKKRAGEGCRKKGTGLEGHGKKGRERDVGGKEQERGMGGSKGQERGARGKEQERSVWEERNGTGTMPCGRWERGVEEGDGKEVWEES